MKNFRNRQTVLMLNRLPHANGHLLLAPARHLAVPADPRTNGGHVLDDAQTLPGLAGVTP